MPKILVLNAAMELTSELKGNLMRHWKVEALEKVSSLYAKIAALQAATKRARVQQTYPMLHHSISLPSMNKVMPSPAVPIPRVPGDATPLADYCKGVGWGPSADCSQYDLMEGEPQAPSSASTDDFCWVLTTICWKFDPMVGKTRAPQCLAKLRITRWGWGHHVLSVYL
jgi:hypothetical protein